MLSKFLLARHLGKCKRGHVNVRALDFLQELFNEVGTSLFVAQVYSYKRCLLLLFCFQDGRVTDLVFIDQAMASDADRL